MGVRVNECLRHLLTLLSFTLGGKHWIQMSLRIQSLHSQCTLLKLIFRFRPQSWLLNASQKFIEVLIECCEFLGYVYPPSAEHRPPGMNFKSEFVKWRRTAL
jgi:hypothetical protein